MYLCTLCRFETALDDIAVPYTDGRCICLRCYNRATDTTRPMPKRLRSELSATLAALDAA